METIPDTHKQCRRCSTVKPRTEFSPRKEGRDGHAPYCRPCQARYMRERRQNFTEEQKAAVKATQRAHYLRTREKQIAAAMRWQKENPERAREIAREAYHRAFARDPERFRRRSRDTYARNPQRAFGYTYAWRKRNPERVRAIERRYRQRHPEKQRHWEKLRRARRLGAEGSHTLSEWRAKVKAYEGRCHWCHETIQGKPTKDHLIPLAKGGADDIGNVVPACLRCNASKGAKWPHEFMGRLL